MKGEKNEEGKEGGKKEMKKTRKKNVKGEGRVFGEGGIEME